MCSMDSELKIFKWTCTLQWYQNKFNNKKFLIIKLKSITVSSGGMKCVCVRGGGGSGLRIAKTLTIHCRAAQIFQSNL